MIDISQFTSMALVALPSDRIPSEEEIKATISRVATAFAIGPELEERVFKQIAAQKLVKMDSGFALTKQDHKPWVHAARAAIDPFFWTRFHIWLQQKSFPGAVISALDRSTDDILDLLGNPAEASPWSRRGLVLGDVQSGKTITYSALINKAADAGYRFIVLLTGTIENLRRQTQERLDEGFVGYESGEHLKRNAKDVRVGVGLIDARRQGTVFTSTVADFRVATLEALGLGLHALKEPALVVVKKNTRILDNLKGWLERYTAGAPGDAINVPFLLIDDEADNASINTNSPETDPTATNARIRALLKLFRQSTYVGFTATPFANIFVNPDTEAEMLGDDLFPEDFIYTLEAPTNYLGPRKMFLDDDGDSRFLRRIDDVEPLLPAKHDSKTSVTSLPESLLEALRAFLVSNAIRDLRQEGPTHRSMLVNVSQFTNVQDQVLGLLDVELRRIQTDVRHYSGLPAQEALASRSIRALHDTWEHEYSKCGFSWEEVQKALHAAVLPVTSTAVNQRTGPRALAYRAHRDTGLRIVTVGGNSLSRGLTLEGLAVSYFRRGSQMYDTLLQMGRWFGYRPGYADLCRVYLEQGAIDWYGHIADATDELRSELRRMHKLGRTPKDFGLQVRAHPDALLVTARNKMRTAQEVIRYVTVSNQAFESVELPRDAAENWRQGEAFVATLGRYANKPASFVAPAPYFTNVKSADVADFLRAFRVAPTDFRFQPGAIAELVDALGDERLGEWDVAIPQGTGNEKDLGPIKVSAQKRNMPWDRGTNTVTVSGNKRRVGSRGVEKFGLDSGQVRTAESNALKQAIEDANRAGEPPPDRANTSDRYYRAVRTRPLLVLHILQRTNPNEPELPTYFLAIGLSFPNIPGDGVQRAVKYKVNLIRARELLGASADPGDDDDPSDLEP